MTAALTSSNSAPTPSRQPHPHPTCQAPHGPACNRAQNSVLSSVTGSEIGKASGAFNMLCYLGGVFGIVVLVAVFAHTGNFRSTQAFSEGFALPIGACASLSLAPPKEQASISLTYHSPFIKEGDSPQIIPRHKDNRGEISSVANLSEG
jgi:hypothetical protein